MDQRIFDQLDTLERGARVETRPTRDVYNDSSAGFSAYDGYAREGMGEPHYQQDTNDEFTDQPMVLDAFGKCLVLVKL